MRRLVAPLMRGRHPPEYTARGTAVGLAIAFTPTVGIQIPAVFLLWVLARYLRPTWEFNLLVAIAWTWLTNVFTMAPVYYVFLVTGRILLGRWDRLRGFEAFSEKLTASLSVDAGFLETLWVYMRNLFEQFGLPMWVGSIPWAALFAWIGYRWSLRLVIRIRTRRMQRQINRVNAPSERYKALDDRSSGR
jgi:uncharacterized protein (DUF2062 family)